MEIIIKDVIGPRCIIKEDGQKIAYVAETAAEYTAEDEGSSNE